MEKMTSNIANIAKIMVTANRQRHVSGIETHRNI